VVEPVEPLQRGDLDLLEGAQGAAAADQLGLVEAVEGLGERVVVAAAGRPDGGVDPGGEQPVGQRQSAVLGAAVAVVDQPGQIG